MKQMQRPLYLIVFVTVPQLILLACLVASGAFWAVYDTPQLLISYLLLAASAVVALVGGCVFFRRPQAPPKMVAFLLALHAAGCVLFTGFYFSFAAVSSFSVEALTLALCGVSLAYLCLLLALCRRGYTAAGLCRQLLLTVALPFGLSLLSGMAWRLPSSNTVLMALGVGLLCAAAVFFIQWLLSFMHNENNVLRHESDREQTAFYGFANHTVLVAIFSLALIPIGLLVNLVFDGLLGDFSSPWFFVIGILNGILMLPAVRERLLSLPYLYFKIIGFSLIAYLTVVFVPFMPLGVPGIIVYGMGLLVFVPLVVCIMELRQLIGNVQALRARWSGGAVALVVVLGALTVPFLFTANAYADRANYRNAQAYMDPRADAQQEVDTVRLYATLQKAQSASVSSRASWGDSFSLLNDSATPVFTPLYNRIVFDGEIMSADSTYRMCAIFYDEKSPVWDEFSRRPSVDTGTQAGESEVLLQNAWTSTEYDEANGVYMTWVNLELYNPTDRDLREYAVSFDLPAGCFIRDHYLYVGDEQKFGMLADRRAAVITYQRVVSAAQDPGLVYYADADTIELRVFPFGAGETRQTGFLVMHAQPEALRIGGAEVALEAPAAGRMPIDMGSVSFIPGSHKAALEAVERTPVYYFIVDTSGNSPVGEHIRKIEDFASRRGVTDARVLFASYRIQEAALADLPAYDSVPDGAFSMKIGEEQIAAQGGFNLATAMYRAQIREAENGGTFPVMVAVTDNIAAAALPGAMEEAAYFPESDYYYNLNYDATLTPYALADHAAYGKTVELPIVSPVVKAGSGYAKADGKSEVIYSYVDDPAAIAYGGNAYENAFLLAQKTLLDETSADAIRDAFRLKTLTTATAFTVFETAEQEAELLHLQEKLLNGGDTAAPDSASVTTVSMDEGVDILVAVAVAAGLLLLARLRRRRRAGM